MTISASVIDAALKAGNSPRMVAKAFKIKESHVLARVRLTADEIERRREEAERRRAARAAAQAEADKFANRDKIDAWLALDIRYENEPSDPPFNYARAFSNTVRFQKRADPNRTLGGVTNYDTREAA